MKITSRASTCKVIVAVLTLLSSIAVANPPASKPAPKHPSFFRPTTTMLPNPFQFFNGDFVHTAADWNRRRTELLRIVSYEYGGLPPENPLDTRGIELSSSKTELGMHKQFLISCGPGQRVSFVLDVLIPRSDHLCPVILRGDMCWGTIAEPIADEMQKRGYIVAQFDRLELGPDNANRTIGIYAAFPNTQAGSLAAWAWGYHRAVDFLITLPEVDKSKVAITGLSRGGKAVLLAGATDDRVALTNPNASGTGGAAPFRFQTPKDESLGAITHHFPFWFGSNFINGDDDANPNKLHFDQHELQALCAPRALLCTEATEDIWGNPRGSMIDHLATLPVYQFLGAADKLAIHFRKGVHDQTAEDYAALLDFADYVFYGKKPATDFSANPYPDLPKTFDWSSPAAR